jgi:hypothetical protein
VREKLKDEDIRVRLQPVFQGETEGSEVYDEEAVESADLENRTSKNPEWSTINRGWSDNMLERRWRRESKYDEWGKTRIYRSPQGRWYRCGIVASITNRIDPL